MNRSGECPHALDDHRNSSAHKVLKSRGGPRIGNEIELNAGSVAKELKAISELEQALGRRLRDRGPQGVEPTIYGRELVKCSVAVFDELRQGVKALEFLSDPTAGELRIGCTERGAAGFVPTVIDRDSRRYPRIVFMSRRATRPR
jgi:hypothetical protein